MGGSVTLRLAVRNRTGEPIQLPLPSSYPHDFVVETPDGRPIWRLAFGKVIVGGERIQSLEDDEELAFEVTWNLTDDRGDPVPPGDYFVRGILRVQYPFKMETGQALRITP